MSRKKNPYPVPRLETRPDRPGRFYLYWSWERKLFRVALGVMPPTLAEEMRGRAVLALQGVEPWPELLADAPAVQRWECRDAVAVDATLLESYRRFVTGDVASAEWAATSVAYVKKLLAAFPDPLTLDAKAAHAFFVAETEGKASGTRNKKLQAWTKFYAYLQRTHHLHRNPFAGIRYVRERHKRNADIVYLSKPERAHLLAVAESDKQGVGAWLGLCTGMRRKEIFDAEWGDIEWESETIHLPETKTGHPRTIPLPDILLQVLRQRKKKTGMIVPWHPTKQDYKDQSKNLLKRLRARRDTIPANHIGFNVFRHTFASHLVQAGVSLSKVAYYLGDRDQTVRERYSRFLPKDKKDRDIDKGFA